MALFRAIEHVYMEKRYKNKINIIISSITSIPVYTHQCCMCVQDVSAYSTLPLPGYVVETIADSDKPNTLRVFHRSINKKGLLFQADNDKIMKKSVPFLALWFFVFLKNNNHDSKGTTSVKNHDSNSGGSSNSSNSDSDNDNNDIIVIVVVVVIVAIMIVIIIIMI